MSARSLLLAGVRAPARRSLPIFSPSLLRSTSPYLSQYQRRSISTSGPSESIEAHNTNKTKHSSPVPPPNSGATNVVAANRAAVNAPLTPPTPASTSSSTSTAASGAGAAPIHPSLATSLPVSAGTVTSGSSNAGGNGGGMGGEPRIIIEKVKRGRVRTWVVRFARGVLVTVLGGASYILYRSYVDRHPPDQLPHDPSKKNLVILGNGWASTAMLKAIDTEGYNVTVVSPRNYFLFTPLLPSVTVGTLDGRSIIEPTRFITRHKVRSVDFLEGEATDIDISAKTLTISDTSDLKAQVSEVTIPYDYLVVNVGAENQTFGIKGVKEHACFLKESWDAEKIRTRLMDCIETATFKGQTEEEIKRLLHMVVVGGGPTGVEYAGELHDFLKEDLQKWYPEIAGNVRITLIEALPNVLPMFSKQLIDYTSATFKENQIEVLTKTMVKEVADKYLIAQDEKKNLLNIPYGLLVWATGNTARPLTKQIMAQVGEKIQNQRRGLVVDEQLRVAGLEDVWACGDATATNYAPTAQVASQQGKYLARVFEQIYKKEELELALEEARSSKDESRGLNIEQLVKQYNRVSNIHSFSYSHQGSLAYIGSDKAIADLPFFNGNLASGGLATYYFWRSAYVSTLFSLRNRSLVIMDWVKVKVFGRDVSRE